MSDLVNKKDFSSEYTHQKLLSLTSTKSIKLHIGPVCSEILCFEDCTVKSRQEIPGFRNSLVREELKRLVIYSGRTEVRR